MPTKKRKAQPPPVRTRELRRVRAVEMRELMSPEELIQHLWSVFHKNEFLNKELERFQEANSKLRSEKDALINRVAQLQSERRSSGRYSTGD